MDKILHGDSLELLKDLDDNSVDSVVTDPPYGYSFMGKDWDKALPDINIWKECVRVLKPGGFAFIMTAPRSDIHSRMCLMLEEAGFRIDFTPIAWTYATGFPKAMNIGKAVDKRKVDDEDELRNYLMTELKGVDRKDIAKVCGVTTRQVDHWIKKDESQPQTPSKEKWDTLVSHYYFNNPPELNWDSRGKIVGFVDAPIGHNQNEGSMKYGGDRLRREATSDKAKQLDGSYAGYQPKPAWENVIVCMKPLSEKGYLDQAMKNQKGITWLDDCRIPFQGQNDAVQYEKDNVAGMMNFDGKYEKGSGKNYEGGWEKPNRVKRFKKKSDYEKYVEKQKSFKGAKTIGEINEGGNTFLGGDIKQLNPSETYQKPKTTKRKPREEGTVFKTSGFKSENNDTAEASPFGRFAANLLVQDNTLSTDDFSRYYNLDAWWEKRIKELPLNVQTTYPFMIVPKASKSEKNKGCEGMEEKNGGNYVFRNPEDTGRNDTKGQSQMGGYTKKRTNFHPTVKPISLMSYLITMGSRENDLVLDPFVGSGTTCIAAKLLNRKYLGMEMDDEYVVIAKARIKAHKSKKQKHRFF